MKVTRAQARAIAAFQATASGTRWLAARASAFPPAQERYHAFRSAALARGVVRDPLSESLQRYLPR
jgi:hypothetical protein